MVYQTSLKSHSSALDHQKMIVIIRKIIKNSSYFSLQWCFVQMWKANTIQSGIYRIQKRLKTKMNVFIKLKNSFKQIKNNRAINQNTERRKKLVGCYIQTKQTQKRKASRFCYFLRKVKLEVKE